MTLPNRELLVGWSEIAGYLKMSERTAIRYYKEQGLPVKKDRMGHPVIKKSDLDKWRTIK